MPVHNRDAKKQGGDGKKGKSDDEKIKGRCDDPDPGTSQSDEAGGNP